MSADSQKTSTDKAKAGAKPAQPPPDKPAGPPAAPVPPPLFRKVDWLAMLLTIGIVWITYFLTVAPELTLEDSGELCTGSFYAGIPHPPGYPVWSLYSWLWTVILPVGNVAWRVAVGEATAGAIACGLLALMVSRGSSMLMEGIEELKGMTGKWEGAICLVSGVVAGLLVGFDSIMWSESVAVNRICVYSVPFFLTTLILCLRWMYAPHQYRYLYWAMFMYGLSITTHQSLMVASIGLEILIAVRSPRLGRDIFLGNFVIFLLMWVFKWVTGSFIFANIGTGGMFVIFNLVGCASLAASIWLAFLTQGIATEIIPATIMGALCVLGICFYFYEPISGSTTPPMQWGYPRTLEGFIHALTRGQYEQPNPTNFLTDPGRYVGQLWMLVKAAAEEFTWVNILIALVPFGFMFKMQKRERSWLIGLAAIYMCVGVLLMDLMNPTPDKASSDLIKVFFTSSHTVIAACIGYGLALIAAYMATHYQKFRYWGLIGGAFAVLLGFYTLFAELSEMYKGVDTMMSPGEVLHWIGQATAKNQYALTIYGALLFVALPVIFLVALAVYRNRAPLLIVLGLFCAMPLHSALTHWFNSEQRNHWFGYWFGHDMFTPPFNLYPDMTKNAVLFGGTDPGRFCPTYMIFCDSFIPHKDQPPMDQNFDRRDVYIITQNALADGTYLDYIRSQYNRSAQFNPPFFQELFRLPKERELNYHTNFLARLAFQFLDVPLTNWGARVEARRRAEGVYPPKEIYTPSPEDSSVCFNNYMMDAQKRFDHDQRLEHDLRFPTEPKQLRPGEPSDHEVRGDESFRPDENGRISVSGNSAVMSINGLLTKVIFDHNPTNDFYVEESFPLDWMYPYLTPYGIIMKINRDPVPEITQEMCARDHEFWKKFSARLTGDWMDYDTKVEDVARFIEAVYLQKNFNGFTNSAGVFVPFTGDRKFVRDMDGGKAFSKLRSSIGGIYSYRISASKSPEEQQRMIRETEFAFKQSFLFCPYSPEAVYRYVSLLANPQIRRFDDAITVVQTCLKLDPNNEGMRGLLNQIEGYRNSQAGAGSAQPSGTSMEAAEQDFQAHPDKLPEGMGLLGAYLQSGDRDKAGKLADQMLANPNIKVEGVVMIARAVSQMGDSGRLEVALKKLTQLDPHSPEAWYDLTALQCSLQEVNDANISLLRMVAANNQRLLTNPTAPDLVLTARKDPRFAALSAGPVYRSIIKEHATNEEQYKQLERAATNGAH
jgi:hypothetical protein